MTSARLRRGSRANRFTGGPSVRLASWHSGQKAHKIHNSLRRAKGIGGTGFAVVLVTGHEDPSNDMQSGILEEPPALRATIRELLPRTAEGAGNAQQARHALFVA